jgi:hypothetical protein
VYCFVCDIRAVATTNSPSQLIETCEHHPFSRPLEGDTSTVRFSRAHRHSLAIHPRLDRARASRPVLRRPRERAGEQPREKLVSHARASPAWLSALESGQWRVHSSMVHARALHVTWPKTGSVSQEK